MQETNHPLISDLEALFRYSGLVDQLRDTSRFLAEAGMQNETTVKMIAAQYIQLRDALRDTLIGKAAEELEKWAPDVDLTTGIDGIHFAAAQLARWIDLVHQTPKFLVAEELAGAAAFEMTTKAKASRAALLEENGVMAGRSAGTYL